MDVGQFRIGYDFSCVRRHLSGRTAHVADERLYRNGLRAEPRTSCRGALAFAPVALVTAVTHIQTLTVLDITLGRRILRWQKRAGDRQ